MRLSDISRKGSQRADISEWSRFQHLLSPTTFDTGRVYSPESLRAMQFAFDQAWSVVGGNVASRDADSARQRLAKALLSVADENCRDVERMKREALQAMALSYRHNPRDQRNQNGHG